VISTLPQAWANDKVARGGVTPLPSRNNLTASSVEDSGSRTITRDKTLPD